MKDTPKVLRDLGCRISVSSMERMMSLIRIRRDQ